MINISNFYILNILAFVGPNHILSLITFMTNIGPYDILYGYICYFDKFDRNGKYSTTTKELSISLFMSFRIFNFGQIKMIFRGDEHFEKIFIANVNVYRYSNLIKTDKYFRTNCCLVINFKILKLNKIPYYI